MTPIDESRIAAAIASLLDARDRDATICPSEVARMLEPDDEAVWRASMPRVRETAARLAAAGKVRITRGGVVVDALAPGGPIRIGHPRAPEKR